MKNLLNKIVDSHRKRKILEKAVESGCDVDGDIVNYKGINYLVHIMTGFVMRVEEKENK